jgi:hydrogenase maturation protease
VKKSPILIFGYGNPSRGDDALGPELLRLLEEDRASGRLPDSFETLTDFQLQIEHATDLEGRELVLFVDASVAAEPPFQISRLQPQRDNSYTSHAMSPAAVLAVFEQVMGSAPPPTYLLTIPGYDFELGHPLSTTAQEHLSTALRWARELLQSADPIGRLSKTSQSGHFVT